MVLRSRQFDDIYFSVDDGLAESRHVFLEGNNLPNAWRSVTDFTIVETGFGTGLNLFATWQLFEETAAADQKLHFISFEQYPLAWDDVYRALQPWRSLFSGRMSRLRTLYPLLVPGFHRLALSRQVSLTLIFDDVNQALPQLDAPRGVDAWFLDGFAPAKNPQMWTPTVFKEMARLSHGQTSFATFTVASAVRHGLTAAGFQTERKPGYGRKREMLTGTYPGGKSRSISPTKHRIAIIGAGLAGTAAAHVLREKGHAPELFEARSEIASGASGNVEGMFNPRLSARRTAISDFYTASFAHATRHFADLQSRIDIGYNPCGSLHLITDAERQRKFSGAIKYWGWPETQMRRLGPADTTQVAGVPLLYTAIYLPASGTISPIKLSRYWATNVPTQLATSVTAAMYEGGKWRINNAEFDSLVLAGGAEIDNFPAAAMLPFQRVRGQLTEIQSNPFLYSLKTNLCFDGYLSPQQHGRHYVGATFHRGINDTAARPEDDADNLSRLTAILPGLSTPAVLSNRVGFRLAARDYFPVIGALTGPPGLYISAAHGSHGIISSLAGAHLIADFIDEAPRSLARDTINALSAKRFDKIKV